MGAIKFKRQGGGASSAASAVPPSSLNYGEPACDSAGYMYCGAGNGAAVSKVKNADNANHSNNSDVADSAKNGLWLYSASLSFNGWVSDTTYTGYNFRQTVNVTPIDGGTFTANTVTDEPLVNLTGNAVGDEAQMSALNILRRGYKIPGVGKITFYVTEKPTTVSSLNIYMRGREFNG